MLLKTMHQSSIWRSARSSKR